jgi:hypothetical protein
VVADDTVAGEYVVFLADDAAMRRFAAFARDRGWEVLGTLPRGGGIRVRAGELPVFRAGLARWNEQAEWEANYVVRLPPLPENQRTDWPRGVAFGPDALAWLGVERVRPESGAGVTVAVLDTLLREHPSLDREGLKLLSVLNPEPGVAVGSDGVSGHGTAVASLIAGNGTGVQGLAPGVRVLGIEVVDATGTGSTFDLAQGILLAIAEGADVISLSLGTRSPSRVLEWAVDEAIAAGVAVVAAVGNDGDAVQYPAAYADVVAVGAVDALGTVAAYSNRGEPLDLTAPGEGVYAAWGDEGLVRFSGTSAAVPFVTGALASLLAAEPGLSALEAGDILVAQANDAGQPGWDPLFGQGVLSPTRAEQRNQPGIFDIAATGHYLETGTPVDGRLALLVGAQNRGTEALDRAVLTVSVDGRERVFQFIGLGPGDTVSARVEVPVPTAEDAVVLLRSRVSLPGLEDAQPANDSLQSTLQFQAPEPD